MSSIKNTLDKMVTAQDRGAWRQYTIKYGDYSLMVALPKDESKGVELFLNHGKKELAREIEVFPEQFANLQNALIEGELYVHKPHKTLFGHKQKKGLYILGVNFNGATKALLRLGQSQRKINY